MSAPRTGWQTWLLAGFGAVAVLAVVLALFRAAGGTKAAGRPTGAVKLSSSASKGKPVPAPPVGLVPQWADGTADQLLKEEAILRDPTPLFLPTPWNAAENVLPADTHHEPGRSFAAYAPWLTFDEKELKLKFPPMVEVPATPADGFAVNKPERPFLGIGQTDFGLSPLAARHAFVEVVAAGDGQLVLAADLAVARPPGEGGWQPLEFLIAVDSSGLVRPPVLTESSRVAAVDGYFQEYLANGLHIGERLPPGFYRICIGP